VGARVGDAGDCHGARPQLAPLRSLLVALSLCPRQRPVLLGAGSGFGGQLPIALPDEDIVVVFNAWNILPGQRRLPLRAILGRIVNAVSDTKVSQGAAQRRQ